MSPHTPFRREMTQSRLLVRVEVTMKHEGMKAEGGSALPAGRPCCQADPPPPCAAAGQSWGS